MMDDASSRKEIAAQQAMIQQKRDAIVDNPASLWANPELLDELLELVELTGYEIGFEDAKLFYRRP